MAVVTMKNLLESGVHFGHQTKRWDPKMAKFIYTERNGIHIIDLKKTILSIKDAYDAVRKVVLEGKNVLFVGTKKQAQQAIEMEAKRCGMFYVNNRWLGGMLTNFSTIKRSVAKLKSIEKQEIDGTFESLTKKEISILTKEKNRLEKYFGGIKEMQDLPGIIFIVDTKNEAIAVAEANKCGIPVVAVIDTNCNPDGVDFPIPGNDDAIRAISLFTSIISNAVIEADNEVGLQIVENIQDEDLTDETILAESAQEKEQAIKEAKAADEAKFNKFKPKSKNRVAKKSDDDDFDHNGENNTESTIAMEDSEDFDAEDSSEEVSEKIEVSIENSIEE